MKIEIPDEYIPRLILALETYAAYERSRDRDATPFIEAAAFFKRKGPGRQESTEATPKGKKPVSSEEAITEKKSVRRRF